MEQEDLRLLFEKFRPYLGNPIAMVVSRITERARTRAALYPKEDDLGKLERFGLSVGLSLALVPLVGLLLTYTPWGIRLDRARELQLC